MASLEMLCSAECFLPPRRQKPDSRFCTHCRHHWECQASVNADREESSCTADSAVSLSGYSELNP